LAKDPEGDEDYEDDEDQNDLVIHQATSSPLPGQDDIEPDQPIIASPVDSRNHVNETNKKVADHSIVEDD